jgi:uncharacterized protein YaaN involved in tellurite resistance
MCKFLRHKHEDVFPARVTTFFTKIFFKNPSRIDHFFRRRIYCCFLSFKKSNKQNLTVNKMCKFLRHKHEDVFPARVTTFFTKIFFKNPSHIDHFFRRRIYCCFLSF